MGKFFKFLSGFLFGAVIGGSLALLFAPSSGKQLMDDANIYFQNAYTDVKKAAESKRIELEKQLNTLRNPKPILEKMEEK